MTWNFQPGMPPPCHPTAHWEVGPPLKEADTYEAVCSVCKRNLEAIKATMPMTTPEIVPEYLRELIVKNNNITVERCAQVVEKWGKEVGAEYDASEIAAAIRELKEES